MRCPFLIETTAHYCDVDPTRLLADGACADMQSCPCAGPSERACPFVQSGEIPAIERTRDGRCTHFHERRVLACDANPTREFLPYVQGLLSRCQSETYRYCPSYLSRESPAARMGDHAVRVDDLIVADDRAYSPNHWWADECDGGSCVLGIDSLVTFSFPRLDVVHFVARNGVDYPQVILVGTDVHVELELPIRVEIVSTNVHVRRHPELLLSDPYGAGWLFEVRSLDPHLRVTDTSTFVPGEHAAAWMATERRRLEDFVRTHSRPRRPEDAAFALDGADGGLSSNGILENFGPIQQAHWEHEFLRWGRENT